MRRILLSLEPERGFEIPNITFYPMNVSGLDNFQKPDLLSSVRPDVNKVSSEVLAVLREAHPVNYLDASLWDIVSPRLYRFLGNVLKAVVLIDEVIEQAGPEKLTVISEKRTPFWWPVFDDLEPYGREFARKYNASLNLVRTTGIKYALKKAALHWYIRHYLRRLPHDSKPGDYDTLLSVSATNHISILEPLAERLGSGYAFVMEPSKFREDMRNMCRYPFLYLMNTDPVYLPVKIKKRPGEVFYRDIDIMKLIWPRIKVMMNNYFGTVIPSVLKSSKKLLEDYSPESILTVDFVREEDNALAHAARMAGVRFYSLPHGILPDYIPPMVPGDKVFVYSQQQVDVYMGSDTERLEIVGYPPSDRLLKINVRGKYLTYFTQPLVEDGFMDRSEYISHLKKLIPNLVRAGLPVMVKVHPRDDESFYTRFKGDVVVTKDMNIYDVISETKVALTWSSTVALDAMVLGIPVIVLNTYPIPLSPYAGLPDVKNYGEISSRVEDVLQGGIDMNRLRTHWLGPLDGRVNERILRELTS